MAEGLVEIAQETAEGWRRVTVEQCYQIVRTLMTPVDEAPPSNVKRWFAERRCPIDGAEAGRTAAAAVNA